MKNNIYTFPVLTGIIVFFLLTANIRLSAQVTGEFPYFESFLNDSPPDGIHIPKPDNNSVTFSKKGVLLTPEPASSSKFGAIILNNHSFDASAGIFISFEYMIYGGNGGDGMSVFFFDASKSPYIGAAGAGIGYTYNRSYNDRYEVEPGVWKDFRVYRAQGLNGAYLGIALDSYGNFKQAFYQGEARVQGLPYLGYGMTGGNDLHQTKTDNDITLRGAMSPTRAGSLVGLDVGYVGYPVLVTQSTTQNIGHRLKTSGNYAYEQHHQLKPETLPFPIKGGYEFERREDPGYRRAYIEMFPNSERPGGGFFVSVMIENENRRDTIIDSYLYTQSFTYLENAIGLGNPAGDNNSPTAQPRSTSPTKVLDATVPAALKIGFAAATGNADLANPKRDTHVIKNVRLILPRAAEAYDDFLPDAFQNTPVTFNPLDNDFGYKGTISRIQDPCYECIDEQTFRFVRNNGTEVYDDGSNTIVCTVADTGTWIYDKLQATVLFQPHSSFLGEARIRYNIKGGKGGESPYNQEPYRSTPATLGVNYIVDPNPPGSTFMISNKMVTSRSRK